MGEKADYPARLSRGQRDQPRGRLSAERHGPLGGGTARSELDLVCDRCGKEFSREKVVPLDSLLADKLENEDSEDDIILLDGNELDLDEVVTTAFVLAMDTKNLCSEDCKGLCAKCGADLNLGPCGCRPDVDPRWAALAQLLDDES